MDDNKHDFTTEAATQHCTWAPPSLQQRQNEQSQKQPFPVICRCCLLEQDELTKYLPLDTSATTIGFSDQNEITSEESALYCFDDDNIDDHHIATAQQTMTSTLLDCLNMCAGIDASLTDVEMPLYICLDCCRALEACCEFIRCVQNANKILQRKYKSDPTEKKRDRKRGVEKKTKVERRKQKPIECAEFMIENNDTVKYYATSNADKPTRRPRIELQPPTVAYSHCQKDEQAVIQNINAGKSVDSGGSGDWEFERAGQQKPTSLKQNKGNVTSIESVRSRCDKKSSLALLQELLLDDMENESSLAKSFDSGIEIEDDLNAVQKQSNKHTIDATKIIRKQEHEQQQRLVEKYDEMEMQEESHPNAVDVPRYICNMCNFGSRFKYYLVKHKRLVHVMNDDLDGNDGTEETATVATNESDDVQKVAPSKLVSTTTALSNLYCNICHCYASSVEIMRQHMETHSAHERSQSDGNQLDCNMSILKPFPKSISSMAANKNRTHMCQFCGKFFSRKLHLLKHEYKVHKKNIDMEVLKSKILQNGSPKHAQQQYHRHRKAAQNKRRLRIDTLRSDCSLYRTPLTQAVKRQQLKPSQQESNTMIDQCKKFQCNTCSAEFLFNFELKYHVRTHVVATNVANKMNVEPFYTKPNSVTSIDEDVGGGGTATVIETNPYDEMTPKTTTIRVDHNLNERRLSSISLDSGNCQTPESSSAASPSSASNDCFSIDLIDTFNDLMYLNDFDLNLLDY